MILSEDIYIYRNQAFESYFQVLAPLNEAFAFDPFISSVFFGLFFIKPCSIINFLLIHVFF